jgi:hypothetical protein
MHITFFLQYILTIFDFKVCFFAQLKILKSELRCFIYIVSVLWNLFFPLQRATSLTLLIFIYTVIPMNFGIPHLHMYAVSNYKARTQTRTPNTTRTLTCRHR